MSDLHSSPKLGLSSFVLKIIAIVGMTCNHAATIFYDVLPFPAYCVLLGVGGLTFPTMAFLVGEGYRHTSNVFRYAVRVLIFAVIAFFPYICFLSLRGDVLFTIFAGLVLLIAYRYVTQPVLIVIIAAVCMLATIQCDWPVMGPLMILFAGILPNQKHQALACGLIPFMVFTYMYGGYLFAGTLNALPYFLYGVGCLIAGILLMFYNGERGKHPMKWFFYAYYPAHIAVLGLIAMATIGFVPLIVQ